MLLLRGYLHGCFSTLTEQGSVLCVFRFMCPELKMCIHLSKTIPFLPYCMCKLNGFCTEVFFVMYSKTCLKRPLYNRQNKDLNDKWQLNEGQKYCRMLPFEHSAILWPALSDNRSSKTFFGLLESGRLDRVYCMFYIYM